MAVEFSFNVYGLTRQYERVKIANAGIASDANPVGGTIFYINDTADGEYQFFDAKGNTIESVEIGDKPYAYKIVTPGTRDKYYVYHDKIYNNFVWTYYKGGAYVYETAESMGVTDTTYNNVGSGKTNTEKVMTRDNGAYITADSNGFPTIWYQLQQVRNAKVGGCDDWFVPSMNEAEELRLAIKSGGITGGVIAGSSHNPSIFNNIPLWSSSVSVKDKENASYWFPFGSKWLDSEKNSRNSVFFTRAF